MRAIAQEVVATSLNRTAVPVMKVPIDVMEAAEVRRVIARWAANRESRYVCICNVHSIVTASRDPAHMTALVGADAATPDGAPVAWMMRTLGVRGQRRVSGPDLMLDYMRDATQRGEAVFLYGSTHQTLSNLSANLYSHFPNIRISGAISPPFGELSAEEDDAIVKQINESGASTVWVSLGCPKQERWMHAHRGRINAVMIGVGAAFDFHAGTIKRAPVWMRNHGLEWLHRLLSEPRRLAARYIITNSLFMWSAARSLLTRQ